MSSKKFQKYTSETQQTIVLDFQRGFYRCNLLCIFTSMHALTCSKFIHYNRLTKFTNILKGNQFIKAISTRRLCIFFISLLKLTRNVKPFIARSQHFISLKVHGIDRPLKVKLDLLVAKVVTAKDILTSKIFLG